MIVAGIGTMVWATAAFAGNNSIDGLVVDRNGAPIPRARIELSPGNVELITDREGRFTISYLRDETNERIKLNKKTEYTLEVFKPGYHLSIMNVPYKRGVLELDAVALVPETLKVADMDGDLTLQSSTDDIGKTAEGW